MGHFNNRRMYQAVCAQCGANCELPFQPTAGKSVYCSNCFRAKKEQGGDRRDRGGERKDAGLSAGHFETLNSKLDKIISILGQAPGGKPVLKELEKKIKKTEAKKEKPTKKAVKKAPAKKATAKKPVKKAAKKVKK